MARENRFGMVVLVCLLGALAGAVFAQLLVMLLPGLEEFFSLGVDLSFNLHVIHGGIRFNVAAVLGIIVALIIWRRV